MLKLEFVFTLSAEIVQLSDLIASGNVFGLIGVSLRFRSDRILIVELNPSWRDATNPIKW